MKLGLYGCGNRTRKLVDSVRDKVEAAACFDVDADRARSAAEAYGGTAYTDLDAFLDDPNVEGFLISLFPKHHADALCRAAPLGKPVYLEKPIGTTVADARRVVQAVRAHGLVCHVGFLHRYVRVFRKVTEVLESGRLGEPLAFNVDWLVRAGPKVRGEVDDWRSDPATGGELVQHLGHTFDLLRLWGGDFSRVFAMAHRALWPDSPSENAVVATLAYRDRPALVSVRHCIFSGIYNHLGRIDGSEASLEYEWKDDSVVRLYRADRASPPGAREPFETIGGLGGYEAGGPVDREMMEAFLDAAAGRRDVAVTAEDGLAAVQVSEAIRTSAETGRVVELD